MAKTYSQQPDSINYLSPVGFKFNIEFLPLTNWFLTSVNLPGIALAEINQPTPLMQTQVPGNDLVFDPLNISFLVDENMNNWRELYDWLIGLGFTSEYSEYKNQKTKPPKSKKTQHLKTNQAHIQANRLFWV